MTETHAPMVTGEFRARVSPPPQPPPIPPLPPPGAGIDLLRETVEVQARTIRYLLQNYESLLRKVGHHKDEPPPFEIEISLGVATNFAAQQAIPAGFWVAPVQAIIDFDNHQGGWITTTMDPNDVIYSNGTTRASTAIVGAMPITLTVVHKEE